MPVANSLNISQSGIVFFDGVATFTGKTLTTANATPNFVVGSPNITIDFALDNLALGSSLPSLTSGVANVTLGRYVLQSITTGSANTGAGQATLIALTTGNSNTAFGNGACTAITTTNFNSGFGSGALAGTTGSSNTAVGYSAAGNVLTGSHNVIVGDLSGGNLQGASNNTFVGSQCATGLATGSNNILIGSTAGSGYTTSESSNIAIGAAGTAAESNVMRLGTTGSGAGQVNKAFIAGVASVSVSNSNVVTINTSTGQMGSSATSLFNPASAIQIFDDFIGISPSTEFYLPWLESGFNPIVSTESGRPGVIQNTSIGSGGTSFIALPNYDVSAVANGNFVLGGGILSVDWYFKIITLSNSTNRYVLTMGLGDTFTGTTQGNGAYFQYSDNVNSGNWTILTTASSTSTTGSSNLAATTGWHHANVTVNAAATSVAYSMDGVAINVSPLTTHIPTVALYPLFLIAGTNGTIAAGEIFLDLMVLTQTLTTPR